MPRNVCYFDGTQCKACSKGNDKCIGQDERLQTDIDSLAHPDGSRQNPLDVICQDWATFASGTTAPTPTPGELSLVDCPARGCLGFAFTLPANFTPVPYDQVGAKETHCFDETAWMNSSLVARKTQDGLLDPLCGEPRAAMASDFCTDPTPTPTPPSSSTAPDMTTGLTAGGVAATPTRMGQITGGGENVTSGGMVPHAETPAHAVTPTGPSGAAVLPTPTPTPTPTASARGGLLSWLRF
jgi:hypothetical protein